MTGEQSFSMHFSSSYRYIENFLATTTGALEKRAGTQLVRVGTQEPIIKNVGTFEYIFYQDDTYEVINEINFNVIKARVPLVAGLTFLNLKKGFKNIIGTGEGARIIISTTVGVFKSNANHVFEKQTLTGLDQTVNTNIYALMPSRGVIAEINALHFSKYDSIFDFTSVPFNDPTAPSGAFTLNFAVGMDGEIIDIIFFKSYLIIGTSEAIYRLDVPTSNPFSEQVLKTQVNFQLEKIFSRGLKYRTFCSVGTFTAFATDRGIYAIFLNTSVVFSMLNNSAAVDVIELTFDAKHVTSEDNQEIIQISADFRVEDAFYAFRNDGVAFRGIVISKKASFTRIVAGLRQFVNADRYSKFFVTKKSDVFYIEYNHQFNYLNDNKLVFNWNDSTDRLNKYAFLDCFENFSRLFLEKVEKVFDDTNIFLKNDIEENTKVVFSTFEKYQDVTVFSKTSITVDGVQGFKYFLSEPIPIGSVALGKTITEKDLDVKKLKTYARDQKIYVTFANITEFPFRMESLELKQDTKFHTFFLLAGYEYKASLGIYFYTIKPDVQSKPVAHFFASEKMEVTSFSENGFESKNVMKFAFNNLTQTIQFPTNEWKLWEFINIDIPAGYSSFFLSIQASNQPQQNIN